MLKIKNLTLKINTQKILDNISINFPEGKISALIGDSGAGKTSLLKCIAQIYNNYDGEIKFQNKDLRILSNIQRALTLGFVAQDFNLFTNMTVLKNCVDPMVKVLKKDKQTALQKALDILNFLEISEIKNSFDHKISGGQKQRAAIARAICLESKILLLDEPTSALDPINTNKLIGLLKKINSNKVTIILNSHDINFVKKVSDNIFFMKNGKIIEEQENKSFSDQNSFIDSFLKT